MTLANSDLVYDVSLPWFERLKLVKKIDDINKLKEIIKITPEPEIRTAIVSLTEDQSLLEQVCYEDEDPSVRIHAVSKLSGNNSDILIHLIENDNSHVVRREAVIKLDPSLQRTFHRIMIEETHNEVRRKAMKKLKLNQLEEQELKELAIRGQEPLVRKGAVYQLSNEDYLKEVALSGEDYKIIELAIDKITNIEYLKEIAEKAEFAHGRYTALYQLDDEHQHFFANICLRDENIEVKRACIEKINNTEVLARLRVEADATLQPEIKKKMIQLS